jgi:hypothetical protein
MNLSRFDEKPIHFGFFLGINTMDFRINQYNDVLLNPVLQEPQYSKVVEKIEELYGGNKLQADLNPLSAGFTVGIVSDFVINDAIVFRATPGMSFGNREFVYNIAIDDEILRNTGDIGVVEATYLSVPSTYIDFPVGFRYYGRRFWNTRPYVYLGGTYRYDLETRKNVYNVVHLKRHGAYLDIAMGLNSYLQFFRFTTELRVSLGLNNMIDHTVGNEVYQVAYYGYPIKKLQSNVFSLIFYFE